MTRMFMTLTCSWAGGMASYATVSGVVKAIRALHSFAKPARLRKNPRDIAHVQHTDEGGTTVRSSSAGPPSGPFIFQEVAPREGTIQSRRAAEFLQALAALLPLVRLQHTHRPSDGEFQARGNLDQESDPFGRALQGDRHTPQAGLAVSAAGQKGAAVRAEGHVIHQPWMAQGGGERFAQGEWFDRVRFPEPGLPPLAG